MMGGIVFIRRISGGLGLVVYAGHNRSPLLLIFGWCVCFLGHRVCVGGGKSKASAVLC